MLSLAPPVEAVTPHLPQVLVTVVTGALVLATLGYTLVNRRSSGSWLYLFVLLGGAICIFNEPALDLISQIYFPRAGAYKVFEAYGRVMPAWAVLSYAVFFGSQTIIAIKLLDRGVTRSRLWMIVVGVWISNCALEITMLHTKIYFYFGYQPLRIGSFPAAWLVINVVGVIAAAVVIRHFRSFFTGPRVVLVAAVPPLGQLLGLWIGTPHLVLLNSSQSHLVKSLASLVTIVAGLAAIDAMAKFSCRQPAPHAVAPVEDAAAPSPALAR